ncbi:MAG: caspase family protein [Elusimicrobiales bacterium]|nr:caspase family protein [Elusimicrobiales bacterium]
MKVAALLLASGLAINCAAPLAGAETSTPKFSISLQRTKTANDDRKYAIAFSPDGASAALGGLNLDIWSTKGYLVRNVLPDPGAGLYGFGLLLFSRDGKEVVAASKSEKTVRIYDAASGKISRTIILGGEGNAACLALSGDGATLAIGTTEGYVELWSYASRKLLRRLHLSDSNIGALVFLRDGRLVYGESELFTIVRSGRGVSKTLNRGDIAYEAGLIDPAGRKVEKFSWTNAAGAETLAFSPASELIAIHDKKTVWVLDGSFKVLKTTSAVSYGRVQDISRAFLSPNGAELALITAPPQTRLILLSLPGLERLADYDLGEHWDVNAAYTPDSRFIAIAGLGPSNRLIDPRSGALHLGLYKSADMPVTAAISPDGKSVASGGYSVGLWPIDGGAARAVPSQFLSSKVLFAPDGRHLVVSRRYGIEVTETASGESRVYDAAQQFSPVALSPDGRLLAYMPPIGAAPYSPRLAVREIATGKLVDEVPVNYFPIEKTAFAGDGRYLVWGRGVYDLRLRKTVRVLGTNVLDADRNFLAIAGYQNNVILSDLQGKTVAGVATANRPTVLRFAPGGEMIAVGYDSGGIELRGLPGLQPLKNLRAHAQGVTDLEFSRDGRFLVSSSLDNTTKVWSLKNYSHYTRFSAGGEWLMYTSDGYFDASPRGEALAAMVRGTEVFSLEQFAARNNRPDIILGRMGLGTPEQLAHYKTQYLKRLKKMGLAEADLSAELHAPEAKINFTRRDGKFLEVNFTLSDSRFPLKAWNIYVNNVPLFAASGRPLKGSAFSGTERIELAPGKNKIEVTVVNAAGAESYRAQAYADYSGPAGKLYYLAFGISNYRKPELALSYADKDASDLEAVISRMRPGYAGVFTKVLLNSEATAANIKKAKDFLADAGTDDTVVVFAAGHGGYDRGADPKYYYLPYEADPADLAGTGVQFEEIEALLDGIKPRKKLLLLDTCDSGELDEDTLGRYYATAQARNISPRSYRKPLKKRGAQGPAARPYLYIKNRLVYNDLSRRTGAIVFSSSRGGEISYESPLLRNGFFTGEVIAALSGRAADTDHNGSLSTRELRKYVADAVAVNTDGLQHPTVDRDNLYQEIDFPLAIK